MVILKQVFAFFTVIFVFNLQTIAHKGDSLDHRYALSFNLNVSNIGTFNLGNSITLQNDHFSYTLNIEYDYGFRPIMGGKSIENKVIWGIGTDVKWFITRNLDLKSNFYISTNLTHSNVQTVLFDLNNHFLNIPESGSVWSFHFTPGLQININRYLFCQIELFGFGRSFSPNLIYLNGPKSNYAIKLGLYLN